MRQFAEEPPKYSPDSGFTLIEVMIVILIFSIGVLGTMSMQTASINANATTRQSALAMEYAVDTMERLMQIGSGSDDKWNVDDDGQNGPDDLGESELLTDGIDNDGVNGVDDPGELEWHRRPDLQAGGPYERGDNDIPVDPYYASFMELEWSVTDIDCDGDGTDDAKRIDITVTWEGGNRTMSLSNIRTNSL